MSQAELLSRLLLAVATVLVLCHLLGGLAQRVGQTAVIGEILGGLLLGPSALALAWPGGADWLFPTAVVSVLSTISQLGLVVFLFLLGCELRLPTTRARRALPLLLFGSLVPCFLGGVLVFETSSALLQGSAPRWVCGAFFGLAIAVTALPVLARILEELGLTGTPMGALALSTAAIGDGLMWFGLSALTAVVGGAGHPAVTAVVTAVLVMLAIFVFRPALAAWAHRIGGSAGSERMLIPILLGGCFGFSGVTQLVGLHPAVGAFLFGLVVPRQVEAIDRVTESLRGFTVIVLLPLFFASIGLTTSIGLIGGQAQRWAVLALLLIVAVVAKVAGTVAAARLAGLPPGVPLRLGVLMNCRGVTELVVAAIGYQYGMVSRFGFTLLVLAALVTTASAVPLLRLLGPPRTQSLEPPVMVGRGPGGAGVRAPAAASAPGNPPG